VYEVRYGIGPVLRVVDPHDFGHEKRIMKDEGRVFLVDGALKEP
jgi:hypothetical protein